MRLRGGQKRRCLSNAEPDRGELESFDTNPRPSGLAHFVRSVLIAGAINRSCELCLRSPPAYLRRRGRKGEVSVFSCLPDAVVHEA